MPRFCMTLCFNATSLLGASMGIYPVFLSVHDRRSDGGPEQSQLVHEHDTHSKHWHKLCGSYQDAISEDYLTLSRRSITYTCAWAGSALMLPRPVFASARRPLAGCGPKCFPDLPYRRKMLTCGWLYRPAISGYLHLVDERCRDPAILPRREQYLVGCLVELNASPEAFVYVHPMSLVGVFAPWQPPRQ